MLVNKLKIILSKKPTMGDLLIDLLNRGAKLKSFLIKNKLKNGIITNATKSTAT